MDENITKNVAKNTEMDNNSTESNSQSEGLSSSLIFTIDSKPKPREAGDTTNR